MCERIQQGLAQTEFEHAGKTFYVTLSIGLVEGKDLDADTVLHFADANVYQAKHWVATTLYQPGKNQEESVKNWLQWLELWFQEQRDTSVCLVLSVLA